MNHSEHNSTASLFASLEQGFKRSITERYSVFAEIGGQTLELCFPSPGYAPIVEQCLRGWLIPGTPEPDARFCFWTDELLCGMRDGDPSERWRCRNGDDQVVCIPNVLVIGANVTDHVFYECLRSPREIIDYWSVGILAYQWAGTAGLLPVHGGAVGVNGKGVLLAARGGGGKSSLAAACLLAGMDYVSDDYLLLTKEGTLQAIPLFSTLKLHLDMKARLGLDLPVIWSDASRQGKQVLDVSQFSLCRELPIHGVIFLRISDAKTPDIRPVPPGPISIRLSQTVFQMSGIHDSAVLKAIIKRLASLPAYDMLLCGNPGKNAEALRNVIERTE